MGKESTCSAGDTGNVGLIPESRRSPEGEMTIHSSILAWEIPRTGEPGGLQFMGREELDTTEHNLLQPQ